METWEHMTNVSHVKESEHPEGFLILPFGRMGCWSGGQTNKAHPDLYDPAVGYRWSGSTPTKDGVKKARLSS